MGRRTAKVCPFLEAVTGPPGSWRPPTPGLSYSTNHKVFGHSWCQTKPRVSEYLLIRRVYFEVRSTTSFSVQVSCILLHQNQTPPVHSQRLSLVRIVGCSLTSRRITFYLVAFRFFVSLVIVALRPLSNSCHGNSEFGKSATDLEPACSLVTKIHIHDARESWGAPSGKRKRKGGLFRAAGVKNKTSGGIYWHSVAL